MADANHIAPTFFQDCFGHDERPDVDPATGQRLRQFAAMTGNAQ